MARFICPACNAMFRVAPEHLGLEVACPNCGQGLATHGGGAAAAAPPLPVQPAPVSPPGGWAGAGPTPRRGSPAGLVALLLSVASWGVYLVVANVLFAATMVGHAEPDLMQSMELHRQAVASAPAWVWPIMVAVALTALLSVALAIGSLARPNRKRAAAVIGLILGALATFSASGLATELFMAVHVG
ncbi:MAG: hypothetical protein BIFFINMI_01934 [Phycisphaerae bacterium]|nr:hypothetical protein [Phycisphaerae bacterium]